MENTINKIINENEISQLIKSKQKNITDSSLKWELFHYIKKNSLTKIGIGKYIKDARLYNYDYHSQLAKSIDRFILDLYPNIKIVIWESTQLNEWLNLLLNVNIIYVEVEKEYVDYIFSAIKEKYDNKNLILFKPNNNIISRYLKNDLVVVKTLYSKSPLNKSNKKIKLEKLVVDLIADNQLFDTNEIRNIILGIKENYDIDLDKTLAYANRRRIKSNFLKIWEDTLC